ncbi:MAG: hypothetical protein IKU08_09155 [Clostridia bacterium]|nr:hypothetical protein [Clostridia bacterium]
MTKNDLKTVEARIYNLLFENSKLRGDDYLLYAEYINRYFPRLLNQPLHEALTKHFERGLPSFEGVTRARRKVQRKYPELCSERAVAARAQQEAAYLEYARG